MKLIILDRDGVINQDSPRFIRSPEEWIAIAGSLEAIARLSRYGWCVTIATNQSGLARGYFTRETLDKMHTLMCTRVKQLGGCITHIAICPHSPDAGCDCRKPNTGLLREIEQVTGLRAQGAPFVGDSTRDLQAALSFGCEPVLVRTGHGRETESVARSLGVRYVFDDLASFAEQWINL